MNMKMNINRKGKWKTKRKREIVMEEKLRTNRKQKK